MKAGIKKRFALPVAAAGILLSSSITTFAYTGEGMEQPKPFIEAAPIEEETLSEAEETPFSVPGNGQLVDDKADDNSKQFLTIRTKNGNTFFLVLDRSSNAENVYMLSMIDENDLTEFLDEPEQEPEKEPEPEQPSVVLPEPAAEEPAEEPEEKEGGMNKGTVLTLALLLAGGIGGGYYFKVLKPRKEENAEDEDLELYDGGAYINEDAQAASSDEDDREE